MEIKRVIKELDLKGEVSLETWKPISAKKNGDGTIDILYRNLLLGDKRDPVFLWVYVNVVEDEEIDVRILERMTFKKEDLIWIMKFVSKFG
ncbi:hypothetical protein E3E31_05500 [Thermococcus sp. M39]|uniref:hypothetical protein n=1 Tax=unclassified Thermococcus TaxID=2627626 RepID=UPI00143C7E0A|nr:MULTISPECIES: hypothetical protein [unclassified Thermococcus]NJE07981.1 hypothetical protein [Thermococcus sp. M39]NJE13682.1 hypothetical protein [Thermococcus sp. LS2]